MPRFLLLLLALLLLSACSSTPRFASQDLQHHHWVLDKLDGQAIPSSRINPPDIEIGEHLTVNGIAGCNRYFGTWTRKGDGLTFGKMGSTMMACAPSLMQQEEKYLKALETASGYSFTADGALVIATSQGPLKFRKD